MINTTSVLVPELLVQIKVMIYHVEDDIYCNTSGHSHWINNLNWPYIPNFMASRRGTLSVMGNTVGYGLSYSNLTYVQIFDVGNMVGAKTVLCFEGFSV